MKLHAVVWLVPFLSFLGGYYLLHTLHHTHDIITPALVGMNLQEACAVLSQQTLSPHLLYEKEDADLPHGTILNQTPSAGQKIKKKQSIFLTVSKQPTFLTPNVCGKTQDELIQKTKESGLRNKSYFVPSTAPQGYCIGQLPRPQQNSSTRSIITYLSTGTNIPIIVPDLKNKPAFRVLNFLQKHNVQAQFFHQYPQQQGHACDECIVIDQRPVAGSLCFLDQLKIVHLQVQ